MYVGVDVTDTKISMGLVSDNGEVSFPSTFTINPKHDPEKLILDLIYVIKSISETIPLELFNDRLLAIGVGIRGTVDKNSGKIIESSNPRLKNMSLQERIQRHFDIPIFVENYAVAADLAKNEIGVLKDTINNQAEIIAAAMLCKYMW